MDTLLIVKDTVAVNILNIADLCKQRSQEIPTNEYDLGIAIAICACIFLVAIVVTIGFNKWQGNKFKHLKELDSQENDNESARREKDYQREKERNDREVARKEKEYQHEKEKSEWDNSKKDRSLSESLKLICDAAKDNNGLIKKEILELLLSSYNLGRGYKSKSDKVDD